MQGLIQHITLHLFCIVIVFTVVRQQDVVLHAQSYTVASADTGRINAWAEQALHFSTIHKDSVRYYADKALAAAQHIGYDAGVMRSLLAQGMAEFMQGNYDKALRHELYVLQIAERLHASREEALACVYLANLYQVLNQQDQSLAFVRRACSVLEKRITSSHTFADTVTMVQVYTLAMYPYSEFGFFEQALAYGTKALDLARRARYKAWMPTIIGIVADQYASVGRLEEAEQLAKQALADVRRENDAYFTSLFADVLGEIYVKQHKYNQALPYLLESVSLAEQSAMRIEMPRVLDIIAEIYHHLGDNAKAYDCQRRSKQLQDSLYTVTSAQHIAEMQARYDTERKEQQIRLLESKQRNEVLLRWILLGGLVLTALVVLAMVRSYRQKRRNEMLLTDKNTELSLLNTHFQSANKRLHDLNNEKNELLGIVAHDLKSPLAGISLSALRLQESLQQSVDKHGIADSLGQIAASAETMNGIVTRLLDVHTIESGVLTLKPTKFNIVQRLQAVMDDFQQRADQKSITFHVATEQPCMMIYADKNAVHQVLDNLLSNALKFSPLHSNIWVSVCHANVCTTHPTHAHTQKHPQEILITVRDEGMGIREADTNKLFTKFARLSAKPTNGESSTGLGLSIVKRLVESMNGRVWCESSFGKGATFFVALPTPTFD